MGYTGQASFGQNAFAALGGYGTAILCTDYNWSRCWRWSLTMAFSGVVALVVGYPTLRLRGHYLAMATFALGLITYEISVEWTEPDARLHGLFRHSAARHRPFEADHRRSAARRGDPACCSPSWVFASYRLRDSRFGRALRAIAGSEPARERARHPRRALQAHGLRRRRPLRVGRGHRCSRISSASSARKCSALSMVVVRASPCSISAASAPSGPADRRRHRLAAAGGLPRPEGLQDIVYLVMLLVHADLSRPKGSRLAAIGTQLVR